MGFVRVRCTIGPPNARQTKEVLFLVGTGAYYTTIPSALADELDIKPIAKTKLTLADKRIIEVDTSLAYIKILDREGVLQVLIMDVPEPILGISTLEVLGVKVNPITEELEYSRPYGLVLF